MANLRLIASNYRPFREDRYSRTWLFFNRKITVEVEVTYANHKVDQVSVRKG